MTSAYFGSPRGLVCCCKTYERHLDTVEVWGSSPHGPTIVFTHLAKASENFPCNSSPAFASDRVCLLVVSRVLSSCAPAQRRQLIECQRFFQPTVKAI